MWAYILTKEKKMPLNFDKVITANTLALGDTTVNNVKAFSQEVRMTYIQNRTQNLHSKLEIICVKIFVQATSKFLLPSLLKVIRN